MHGWPSLQATVLSESYGTRLAGYAAHVVPAFTGMRTTHTQTWIVPPALGIAVSIVVAAAVVVRRRPARDPLVLTVLAYPFLIATVAEYWHEPRYAIYTVPVFLLLGARWALSRAAQAAVLAVAITVSALGVAQLSRDAAGPLGRVGLAPRPIEPVLHVLREAGVNRVYATYWEAYRITFHSDEQIIATPLDGIRYCPHDRLVVAHPAPAFVVVRDSPADTLLAQELRRLGVGFRVVRVAQSAVYLPDRHVMMDRRSANLAPDKPCVPPPYPGRPRLAPGIS
jgi:hypothetical protein